ncbi:DUF1461 domain-containing protein [Halioxenophilus aromaticivorans]|uniref:DUF1461 domain-containing protein n=1 Tax=Halioxenophilus aromaticivorans TaxID=1306992 RepID=A0AAV3UAK7_9ALTE
MAMDQQTNSSTKLSVASVPFVFAGGIMILWLSWQLLSMLNFTYPLWYRVLDIHSHIQTYAPQNNNKSGFEETTIQERYRLYYATVTAVNNDGEGLAQIRYRSPTGEFIDTLYTDAEVLHLQDVSNLITKFDYLAYVCVFIVVLYTSRFIGWWGGRPIKPGWRNVHYGFLATMVTLLLIVFIIGPQKVFYWMHEMVFPPDHPWFFYYQDSLMSTSMKAPDLFGALAVQWLMLTLMGYYLWIYGVSYVVKKRIRKSNGF